MQRFSSAHVIAEAKIADDAVTGAKVKAGAARQAQCNLMDDAGSIGTGNTISLPIGASENGSLAAFVNDISATPVGNPQDIRVRCQGAGAAGDVHFSVGDLTVLRVPIG